MRKLIPALLWMSAAAIGICADDATMSKLDALFAPLANGKSPGFAVLVRNSGRTVFERGYGVRDLRTLTRIDANTNFRPPPMGGTSPSATCSLILRGCPIMKISWKRLRRPTDRFGLWRARFRMAKSWTCSNGRRAESLRQEQAGPTAIPDTSYWDWSQQRYRVSRSDNSYTIGFLRLFK